MRTIVLTWNPKKWYWEQYHQYLKKQITVPIFEKWSCRVRDIRESDRFIMLLQGDYYKVRGIIASGVIVKGTHYHNHWDPDKSSQGIVQRFIDIKIEKIVDLEEQLPLETSLLQKKYPKQHWTPQGSGITLLSYYENEILSDFTSHIDNKMNMVGNNTSINSKSKNENNLNVRTKEKKNNIKLDFDDFL